MQNKSANKNHFFLIALFGRAGSGKTTLANFLVKRIPKLKTVITYTTRKPRPGEVNQINYFFVSKETFLKMQKSNLFFESVNFAGNFYGTPISLLDQLENQSLIVCMELEGIIKAKELLGNKFLAIEILAPNSSELKTRLAKRDGAEINLQANRRSTDDDIQQTTAKNINFDLVVKNEILEDTIEKIAEFISKKLDNKKV